MHSDICYYNLFINDKKKMVKFILIVQSLPCLLSFVFLGQHSKPRLIFEGLPSNSKTVLELSMPFNLCNGAFH